MCVVQKSWHHVHVICFLPVLNLEMVTKFTSWFWFVQQLFVLEAYADASFGWFIAMLILCGIFVNGPYAMITTAVSSDLVCVCVCVHVRACAGACVCCTVN